MTDLEIFWAIPNVRSVEKHLELLGVGIVQVGGC